MKINGILVIGLMLFLSMASFAQGPAFTHYPYNQIFYNPAYAGSSNDLNISSINRLQYPKAPVDKYYTPMVAAEALVGIGQMAAGMGGFLMVDHRDYLTDYYVDGSLSYPLIYKDQHRLQLGVGLLGVHKTMDTTKATFPAYLLYDSLGNRQALTTAATALGVNSGVWYQYQDFFLGFSIMNMNQHPFAFGANNTMLIRKYYITAGYKVKLDEYLSFTPSVLYRYNFLASGFEFNVMGEVYQKLLIGYSLKVQEKSSFLVGIDLKTFRVTLAHDIYKNSFFRKELGGAWELGFRYTPQNNNN